MSSNVYVLIFLFLYSVELIIGVRPTGYVRSIIIILICDKFIVGDEAVLVP